MTKQTTGTLSDRIYIKPNTQRLAEFEVGLLVMWVRWLRSWRVKSPVLVLRKME